MSPWETPNSYLPCSSCLARLRVFWERTILCVVRRSFFLPSRVWYSGCVQRSAAWLLLLRCHSPNIIADRVRDQNNRFSFLMPLESEFLWWQQPGKFSGHPLTYSRPHLASSVLVQWKGVASGQGIGLQGEADMDISYISSVWAVVREILSRTLPSDSEGGQHQLVINNQPVTLSPSSWGADHLGRGERRCPWI